MKRILLVDDMEIFNFIMVTSIANIRPDCEVFDFTNPVEAFNAIPEINPDIILLDVNMPQMDGWEFLEKMQEMQMTQKVYVLTSSTSELDKERSQAYSNVQRFMVKPVEEQLLEEILVENQYA